MENYLYSKRYGGYAKPFWRRKPVIFLAIIAFSAVIWAIVSPLVKSQNSFLSPLPAVKPKPSYQQANIATEKELIEKVKKLISESQNGTYSFYVYDLNTKKGFGLDEQMMVDAASVNKIPILASLYHLAGKNEIDLEKIVVPQPSDIQDYGTGSIRYADPGTPYSIKNLARVMMRESDNTAAYILSNHIIGLIKIQTLMDNWSLAQTDITENKTSVKDMAILMTKMYKNDVTSKALSAEMLGFMTQTDIEDRLTPGIPTDVKIYHKTGDAIGKIHDVGIIEFSKRPYFLGVFSIDVTDEEKAKKTIAEISHLVYGYMKSL